MRARKVPGAYQELVHDLAAGEHEGLLEQLSPFVQRFRMIVIEPRAKRAMFAL
jgi:hypothetical protein